MRILVAGFAGQVAQALADSPDGHELTALGRPDLDLTNADAIKRAVDRLAPEVVINAAAYTAVDKAETDEDSALAVNATGAGLLAAAARDCGARFLHLSTDYVFDGNKVAPYVESDITSPMGAYGRTKLAGERAVRAAHPEALILRTAWVYHHGGANFVRTMLRLAESRDEIGVVADQVGCPTYAPDIARALLGLAAAKGGGGTYNLAGSAETTWFGFATAIFEEAALRGAPSARVRAITTAEYLTPARRPANSRLDGTKLRRDYGVALPPWSAALPRCLDRLLGPKTNTGAST